jgi:hypothetical protein
MTCANLPKLPRTLLAVGFVLAAVPLGAAASPAQTSPDQISQFSACEAHAGGRGIEQDAFGKFPTRCMTEVVPPTPSAQERFAECRSQARAREDDGGLYARFLHMCMAAPSSNTAAVKADRTAAAAAGS